MLVPVSALLAVGYVNGVPVDGQRRLVHRFAERRVREHGHAQVLGAAAELHGNNYGLQQVCRGGTDDVATEHAVSARVGQHLDHALGVVGCQGAAAGGEGEHADLVFDAFRFQLFLGLADRSNFRMRVDDGGNQTVVHASLVTGDA